MVDFLESSPVAVGISDPQTSEIRYANPKLCELHSLAKEELVGLYARDLWYDEEDRKKFLDVFERTGSVPDIDVRNRRPDRSIYWCRLTWKKIQFRGQDALLFWVHDIGDLKRLQTLVDERTAELRLEIAQRGEVEETLRKVNEELETRVDTRTRELRHSKEIAEMASRSKTDFLNHMSHELRTPLNAIIGFSDIMAKEVLGSLGAPKYLDYATDINRSGHYLLDLINDILDVSVIESGKLVLEDEIADAKGLIEDCDRMVRPRASAANLQLFVEIVDGLPAVNLDARRTKQVLINLLSNAVKFTPESGEIYVDAGLQHDGSFRISITDTGEGISEKDQEKIFEPFGRIEDSLRRGREGVGLGLAICRSIMELHGGGLEVVSEVGRGTRMTMVFPASRVIQEL